jgi:pimeloyl-ACP methyl ester carboxylesterase
VLCDTRAVADSPEAAENRLKVAESVLTDGTEALARAMLPKLFATPSFEKRSELVDAARQVIYRANPQGVAAAQRGMAARADATGMLASIELPTLVVVGEADAISPVEEMRRIAEAIPGSRFAVIEGAGHMSPLEDPAAFNAALSAFLSELRNDD